MPVGVVTSLEASSLETPFGDLAGLLLAICFGRWRQICRRACGEGGCLPHAKTPALSLVAEGHHSAVVRLLAAFRGVWSCVTVSSAVRDIV